DLGDLDGGGSPADLPLGDVGDAVVHGRFHLDSVRARGETARGVDGEVSLENGRLVVNRLHAGVLDGLLDVEQSWLDLSDTPEFDLHARVGNLDLSRLGAPEADELRGRATGRIDVHGEGTSGGPIARSLRGSARGSVRDLHARPAMSSKITLVNPLLS